MHTVCLSFSVLSLPPHFPPLHPLGPLHADGEAGLGAGTSPLTSPQLFFSQNGNHFLHSFIIIVKKERMAKEITWSGKKHSGTSEAMAGRAKSLIIIIPNMYRHSPCVRYNAQTLTCLVCCGKSGSYL